MLWVQRAINWTQQPVPALSRLYHSAVPSLPPPPKAAAICWHFQSFLGADGICILNYGLRVNMQKFLSVYFFLFIYAYSDITYCPRSSVIFTNFLLSKAIRYLY